MSSPEVCKILLSNPQRTKLNCKIRTQSLGTQTPLSSSSKIDWRVLNCTAPLYLTLLFFWFSGIHNFILRCSNTQKPGAIAWQNQIIGTKHCCRALATVIATEGDKLCERVELEGTSYVWMCTEWRLLLLILLSPLLMKYLEVLKGRYHSAARCFPQTEWTLCTLASVFTEHRATDLMRSMNIYIFIFLMDFLLTVALINGF